MYAAVLKFQRGGRCVRCVRLKLERRIIMTLLELQRVLGNELESLTKGEADTNDAKAIASLAKQMINNADIVLRADKFTRQDGKRINKIVGELDEAPQVE